MEQSFITNTPEESERLAEAIGSKLMGGECIELSSDLGGGKTTFVRGLARGVGSRDQVASPTFTISKRYESQKITIYHYDFYRLQDPGLVAEELAESIEQINAVTVVEWAGTVDHVLPPDRVKIVISRSADSETARTLSVSVSDPLSYLLEGVI